ncbi:MAG TPA: prolyl oligopeptidase family serine peptidase [Stellaceae bacterium]|nr:prolyl oligopeptidase family serine peptidase [Stellaceae bacterium]
MPGPLPTLTGPVHKPANRGAPKKLVALLHGLGADGNDLIGLAPAWEGLLPDAEFISPNAPFPCDMAPYGRQWFTFQSREPEAILAGVRAAVPILDAFLDAALAARGLTDSELAIVGFSQGAMMTLFTGLRRNKAAAALIGYSGAMVGPDVLAAEVRVRPPVLLVHGDADPVVPPERMIQAIAALEAAKVPVEHLSRPGLGHGIDEEGLRRGGRFLVEGFKRAGPPS